MRKIVSLTLVAAMLLSFAVLTSCNQKSAYEQVSEAITNTLALDDLNVVVDEVATQSVAGQSQKAESNFEMKKWLSPREAICAECVTHTT